jgi:acyl transferase domain-containing protein/acyl carrier protein
MMDGILDEFAAVAREIKYSRPGIPFISNLTGKEALAEEVMQPHYWVKHLRHEVKFADGIESVLKTEGALFVEVGPGNTLATFIRTHRFRTRKHKVVTLTRHVKDNTPDTLHLLRAVGELWLNGVNLDWRKFYQDENRRKVSLPAYAFEKTIFSVKTRLTKSPDTHPQQDSLMRYDDIDQWLYAPAWKTAPAIKIDNTHARLVYLIFNDRENIGGMLAERLVKDGIKVISVTAGENYRTLPKDGYELNPKTPVHYEYLFASLSENKIKPDCIVYAWSLDVKKVEYADCFGDTNISGLVHIVEKVLQQKVSYPLHVTLLTNSQYAVSGTEVVNISASPLLGLLKVLPQEHPQITTSAVDIMLLEKGDSNFRQALYNEIRQTKQTLPIAIRYAKRWQMCYERLQNVMPVASTIRRGGVYIITGGLGRLGFSLAMHLLEKYEAKVALFGRTSDSDLNSTYAERLRKLQTIRTGGAEVVYKQCDVSDMSQLSAGVDYIVNRLGKIYGVVHAAGELEKSINILSRLGVSDYRTQLAPKLVALENLHAIFGKHQVDFCLVTSSLSSVLGGVQFAAYAAANIAVDHFINKVHQTVENCNWVTVNFDGLALDNPESQGISEKELGKLFEVSVSLSYLPQLVTSVADLNHRLAVAFERKASVDSQLESPDLTDLNEKNNHSSSKNALDADMLVLWRHFFGRNDIDYTDEFFNLGGDSLKALTMIGRIQKKFNIEIPVAELFVHTSVKKLCHYIRSLEKPDDTTDSLGSLVAPVTYPLSSAQRRLYFLYEFDRSSTAYNMPFVLRLQGAVDHEVKRSICRTGCATRELKDHL